MTFAAGFTSLGSISCLLELTKVTRSQDETTFMSMNEWQAYVHSE